MAHLVRGFRHALTHDLVAILGAAPQAILERGHAWRQDENRDQIAAHGLRELLAEGGAVGRRLDFLCQELNREANTLCSKSADVELTRIGLALKAGIEQLREQVQNIE